MLTSVTSQILVVLFSNSDYVDVSGKLNSGHVDVARKPVSREPTIMRISASKTDLKLKKASAGFFTPFAFLRGSITMIYQFFSDHGRVHLKGPYRGQKKIDIS